MSSKINIGIVGCGAHAQIAHIPFFNKNPACSLTAICDSNIRIIDHLSTKYQIPKKYHDFQEMISDKEIDAVVISTPNYLHGPMAIASLKYGKHVFCENPMAIELTEAEEMVRIARTSGKKMALAANNRLRPDVQALKNFIKDGELGDIYYIKSGWLIGRREWILRPWRLEKLKSGGGAFLSLGTNLLDIGLYFLKSKKPVSIFASIHKREPEAEVEDTAMCIINFADNTLLTIEVSWSLLFEEDFLYCNVFGKKGAALLNPLKIQKELHNELYNVTPTLRHVNLYRESYELQANSFLNMILTDREPLITYEDGLMIARITEAFYESAREQKLIKLDR
jgi:predicted dehydrogenase